jgi:hypothetical protein
MNDWETTPFDSRTLTKTKRGICHSRRHFRECVALPPDEYFQQIAACVRDEVLLKAPNVGRRGVSLFRAAYGEYRGEQNAMRADSV